MRRPLVFLHIPKTSGIAVSHALVTAEKAPRVFFGFDRAFFGGFDDFASVAPENRGFIHLSPDTIPRAEVLVRAHMSLSTLRAAYPDARYFTVLREPFCRLLSHYVFWRGFDTAQSAAWGGWAARSGLARLKLEDFLAAPEVACQIDNVATRLLLWPHAKIPADGMIDPRDDAALAALALDRLRGFDFVDAVENPAFERNLAAWLGAPPERVRMNETAAMPARLRTRLDRELTPRALDLITQRSRLDLLLWKSLLVDADAVRGRAILQGTARAGALLSGQT